MVTLEDSLTRVLAAGPPLRLAVLFGSQARGRAHAGSDVDVAILPRDAELPFRFELDLAGELALAVGREVDVVRLDQASTLLRWEVARHGVPLVAAPPAEWLRFRAAAASEHAEIRDSLEHAAELFRRRILRPA